MSYKGGYWLLENSTWTIFDKERTIVEHKASSIWKTDLTPKKLDVILSDPSKMSMRDIYGYITYLENNKQDANRYLLILWRKAVLPFTVVVMMLLSVSFILVVCAL